MPDVGPLDGSLLSHLPGAWRAGEEGGVACGGCGDVWPEDMDREVARLDWASHVVVPAASNGFQMVWLMHPACEPGKHVVRGTVGAFLEMTMAPGYLRPDLPMPQVGVVQEFVDQGELLEGMGAGFDWPRLEVTGEIYEAARSELVAADVAAPGSDPDWVDSLFFRRVERLAVERGTDVHHEIRRVSIVSESASIRARFPDLHEAVATALQNRSSQANRYDFDRPLDPLS